MKTNKKFCLLCVSIKIQLIKHRDEKKTKCNNRQLLKFIIVNIMNKILI